MSGEYIQKLIRDGDVAAYVDGRFGHWKDLSNNSNHGTPSAGSFWAGFGMSFPTNADEVTIADDPTIRLTTGSIIALLDVHSMTATEYVVAHDNAGSGFSLGINATSLVFTGDGVARTIVTSLYGAIGIGATFVHGGTPIGYVDGLSVGNFSGVVNVTAAAIAMELGNWANSGRCKSIFKAAIVCNRILDAAEMAKAHEDLATISYPSSCWGAAKFEQDVFKREPGLVAGWNMRPVGGVVPDEIGASDGTIYGGIYEPGILGDGIHHHAAATRLDMGDPASGDLDVGTDDFVLRVWVRGSPAGNAYAFTKVGVDPRYYFYVSNTGAVRALVDDGVDTVYADAVAGSVLPDKLTRIVVSFDRSEANGITIFIDGVDATTGRTGDLTDVGNLNNGNPFRIGYSAATATNTQYFAPALLKGVAWTAEDAMKDYLEGACAIQFQSDWGFQQSPSAEGGVLGQQIGTRDSPLRAGDAAFRGLIEAEEIDGELHKVLRCTVAGKIYIPGHFFFDCTSTEACFGSFRCRMYKADASTITWKFAGTDLDAAVNGYAIEWAADESVVVSELGVGNIIAGGSAAHNKWTQFDVTHASDGNFDGYVNETTFGNGNDLTITTSIGLLWDLDVGDKLCIDDIVKFLGVVEPE